MELGISLMDIQNSEDISLLINTSTSPQLSFRASIQIPHLDIRDSYLSRQPFYPLLYLTSMMCFISCHTVSRGMSFIDFSLCFHIYHHHLDYTPQLIHAVQVLARLRMYRDSVTPQLGFWDFHSKVVSRYWWNMNYRKTHTARPSCPSTPFFKARDITHNRDIVDSCDISSL